VDSGTQTPGDMGSDSAGRNAAELREAAATLRGLVPHFRDGSPVSEFVPLTVSNLLEAVADWLLGGDVADDAIRSSALELARHLRTYGSGMSDG
jgi:hypothetical protein